MNEQLLEKIEKLKQQRNAVILAHNYQPGEIQDLADFCGDSLGLRITAEQLRQLKQEHPDALVVCYVNSSAEVKAESDYCCTSANSIEVVNSLPMDKQIIFVPDQHLGRFVEGRTGRDLVLWPGYCTSHVVVTEEDIKNTKAKYPDAVVMAHPECTEPVKELSDAILSTSQMLKYAKESNAKRFIVSTEVGMIYPLEKQNPDAEFIAASEKAICPNMKMITLEKVLWSLEDMQHEIVVPKEIATKAKRALDRMVEILPVR